MKMTAENPKQKCTLGAEMGPSLYNQIFDHFYFWGKNTKIYGINLKPLKPFKTRPNFFIFPKYSFANVNKQRPNYAFTAYCYNMMHGFE